MGQTADDEPAASTENTETAEVEPKNAPESEKKTDQHPIDQKHSQDIWTAPANRFLFVSKKSDTPVIKIEETRKLNKISKPSYVQPFVISTEKFWILTWPNSEYILIRFDVCLSETDFCHTK